MVGVIVGVGVGVRVPYVCVGVIEVVTVGVGVTSNDFKYINLEQRFHINDIGSLYAISNLVIPISELKYGLLVNNAERAVLFKNVGGFVYT